jgi:sugar lactone lactonase YvrE
MPDWHVISAHEYLCGESPRWDSALHQLIWSDLSAGSLSSYDPRSGAVAEIATGMNIGGFAFNSSGGLICASHQGLCTWQPQTGFRLIAASFQGKALRSNDATADARGRFFFGTTFHVQGNLSNDELGKLYMVERTGAISVVEEGIHLSNGLGFSPDDRTLYYTDSAIRTIYAYDYDVNRGALSRRRTFVKVPLTEGIPDGLAVDEQGYVWSAQWDGSCILRYDPEGRMERRIRTPARQTTALAFGGDDLTDIYVTSAAESADQAAPFAGGPVYRCHSEIRGRMPYRADISFSPS